MTRPARIEPGPGQESVWDYPRPPRIDPITSHIRVVHAGQTVVDTAKAIRILETSQPPSIYVPPSDADLTVLHPSDRHTFCEWKGTASYLDLVVDGAPPVADAAWTYPSPDPRYEAITGYLAFYPQRVDACFVDGEQADPGEGSFSGGWITSAVVGPFKGGPGTAGW
ncbi:MAG TPA: DUF427 domain-containing protein [Acidimicrobiales bacterium]|nr:DUF427 domain-containing protein [Acidimicrobiales bacterium]